MKKKLSGILVLVVLCSLLCACQKNTSQVSTDTVSDSTQGKNAMEYTVKDVLSTELFTDENATKIDLQSQNSDLEIKAPGVYALSGKYTGQIVVNTADEGKVKLILNGVEIVNQDSACILVKNADKVVISSNKDSVNILSSTGEFDDDQSNVDAAVFSHDDLTFSGDGTISIISSYGHGIVSKDGLKIKGGTINITSEKKGISGKDSIKIEDGAINVISGTNAVDSQGDTTVSGGDIKLYSNRKDGIHSDTNVVISGGTTEVVNSKEGIEGLTVTISGGCVSICSSDDGVNSSADDSENTALQIGSNQYLTDDGADVTITGGKLTVDAGGDGIDSNGTLNISGGEIYASGSENGENFALHASNEMIISDGKVIGLGTALSSDEFSSGSQQKNLLYNLDKTYESGSEVILKDEDGNIILSFTAPKSFSSVLISCPEMVPGYLYILNVGNNQFNIQLP